MVISFMLRSDISENSSRFPLDNDFMILGSTSLPCRWSGKTIPTPGEAAVEALKDISANDIVIEYYTYEASSLWMWHKPAMRKAILENVVTFMLTPTFVDLVDQHCGIRELYLVSILRDYDAQANASSAEKSKYYASIPTEELKKMVGKYFTMTEGGPTFIVNDDALEEVDIDTLTK